MPMVHRRNSSRLPSPAAKASARGIPFRPKNQMTPRTSIDFRSPMETAANTDTTDTAPEDWTALMVGRIIIRGTTIRSCTTNHAVESSPGTVSSSPRSESTFTTIAVEESEAATAT